MTKLIYNSRGNYSCTTIWFYMWKWYLLWKQKHKNQINVQVDVTKLQYMYLTLWLWYSDFTWSLASWNLNTNTTLWDLALLFHSYRILLKYATTIDSYYIMFFLNGLGVKMGYSNCNLPCIITAFTLSKPCEVRNKQGIFQPLGISQGGPFSTEVPQWFPSLLWSGSAQRERGGMSLNRRKWGINKGGTSEWQHWQPQSTHSIPLMFNQYLYFDLWSMTCCLELW